MTHSKLDHKEEARNWHEQAIAWMEQKKRRDAHLRRFRAEAGALLGPQHLIGLRAQKMVAALRAEERQACQKLWADVEALLENVQEKRSSLLQSEPKPKREQPR